MLAFFVLGVAWTISLVTRARRTELRASIGNIVAAFVAASAAGQQLTGLSEMRPAGFYTAGPGEFLAILASIGLVITAVACQTTGRPEISEPVSSSAPRRPDLS